MRIAVLGAGGIGGYYGALLAKAGQEVIFIARGAHLEAIRRRGLTLRTPAGETTTPVTAVADSHGLEPADLVLFCVKSYDTEAAAQSLPPLVAPGTTVLTLQNGLDNAEAIGAIAGQRAVLRGAVYAALQLAGPGVIVSGGEGKIVFGELDGSVTDRVRRIAGAFQQANIAHDVSPDINRVLWEKFLFITGVGAVTALARSGIGAIMTSPEGRTLAATSCAEIVAVAQAEGAPLGPDAARVALEQAAALPGSWRSSLARDLEHGRRLEIAALSGAVIRRGRQHGLATPVHQTITACLSLHQPQLAAVI